MVGRKRPGGNSIETCAYDKCGKEFEKKKGSPGQRYCTPECRDAAYNESRRVVFDRDGKCRNCDKDFTKQCDSQVYCTPACKAEYEGKSRPKAGSQNNCKVCGREFTIDAVNKVYCSDECRSKGDRPLTPDEEIKRKELLSIEKKVRADVGRTKILADLVVESAEAINAKDIKPYRIPKKKLRRDPETMVILRSDTHPGLITPSYNLDVFHQRMELFTEKIILIHDIISQTIPIEKIVIMNLGDLVSGQGIFHNQAWKSQVHVLRQIYHEAVPEFIGQDLALAEHAPVVEDHYVPGNHGRTGKEFPDEVNFDNILAQDIWRRFEFVPQIDVQPEWGKFKFVDIYGWRFLMMHGNLVRSWLGIPFYGLVTKGMKWQGSMPRGPWQYLIHGHFHVPFEFPWNMIEKGKSRGFKIVSNGSLVSDDDFALEQLGMASSPAQVVFGVHPEHGMTWKYELDLS